MERERTTRGNARQDNKRQNNQNLRSQGGGREQRERELRELSPQEKRRLQRQMLQKKRQRRRRLLIKRLITVAAIIVFLLVGVPRLAVWGYGKIAALRMWLSTEQGSTDGMGAGSDKDGTVTMTAEQVSALPQGNVDFEVMKILTERYRNQAEAANILAHPEEYPDALLALLAKRPETLDFVLRYPEKKDKMVTVDLSGEVTKGTVPLLFQWDERWGYRAYGDSIVALAGCGPTCLSMVMLGLSGETKWDPGQLASFSEECGYVSDVGTAWDLMTMGATELGLISQELPLDENRMIREIQEGHPIICSMRPGDFTDTGHFIVLVGYEDGAFVVRDPNSVENSEKTWTYERIKGQIKNLWAFSLK